MLIPALSKEKELQAIYQRIVYNPKYKYAVALCNNRNMTLAISNSDWDQLQLISYDEKNNKIVGFIDFSISQPSGIITEVYMMNFGSSLDTTFHIDLMESFKKVFLELNVPKVCFSVVIGNPAEVQYDKFIKRYGGSIVGTYKKHTMINNKMYDKKYMK